MEDYIQISKINDFLFCPKSIYFHGVFESFDDGVYHDVPQRRGRIHHEVIENGGYSSLKKYLLGKEVYSEKYGLCGKIDIYDIEEKVLIERKYKVKEMFLGYKYQLYAQAFALEEMGYEVMKMVVHSLADNKRYVVDCPDEEEIQGFSDLISQMRDFDMENAKFFQIESKCLSCIYKPLCH